MPSVELQSRHVTRTTFHFVPHSEQLQNRVLWALAQSTTALVTGGLPHTGQAPFATSFRSSPLSKAAMRVNSTCRAARARTRLATSEDGSASLSTVEASLRSSSRGATRSICTAPALSDGNSTLASRARNLLTVPRTVSSG